MDERERGPWETELIDLVRGASGGLLFGVPLLYTMEVWWTGMHTTPLQSLIVLAVMFVPVFLLNRTAGFRSTKDIRLADALKDTVEVVALGVILVAAVLVLLREIRSDTPPSVAVAKIVYEAFPFCLGISVARHLLHHSRTGEDEDEDADEDEQRSGSVDGPGEGRSGGDERLNATVADIGAGVIGSAFIAFNIAPTDEIPMLHAQLSALRLLALVAVSLLVSYAIVFVAGFVGQEERHAHEGLLQRPGVETVMSYLIALAMAYLLLALFQRTSGASSATLGDVVVLGLPAAIGSAAGRVAI